MSKRNLLILTIFLLAIFSCKKENEAKKSSTTSTISLDKKLDTLTWETELCLMKSPFDASKYQKKQLEDTYKLWFSSSTYIDFDGYPVFDLDKKLMPIEKLEEIYASKKREIESLQIVDAPFWKNIKILKLKELRLFYENKKTAVLAYFNPGILIQTNYKPETEIYVDALASRDSIKMIEAWRELNEEQKAKNASPDRVEKKFQSMLNSSRALEYAKMELFSFGWSNNTINPCEECEILSRTGDLQKEFEKLFITTVEECDEP
jgi:hypothetical protein